MKQVLLGLLCAALCMCAMNANQRTLTKEEVKLAQECKNNNMQSCTQYLTILCGRGGSPEACGTLANIYYDGDGVVANLLKAKTLYEKSCNAGYAEACLSLGKMYYNGEGLEQDFIKAKLFFEKACSKKNRLRVQ